eukprot:m51a1_g5640 hypothetical protein (536) ;mRNA; r:846380-848368
MERQRCPVVADADPTAVRCARCDVLLGNLLHVKRALFERHRDREDIDLAEARERCRLAEEMAQNSVSMAEVVMRDDAPLFEVNRRLEAELASERAECSALRQRAGALEEQLRVQSLAAQNLRLQYDVDYETTKAEVGVLKTQADSRRKAESLHRTLTAAAQAENKKLRLEMEGVRSLNASLIMKLQRLGVDYTDLLAVDPQSFSDRSAAAPGKRPLLPFGAPEAAAAPAQKRPRGPAMPEYSMQLDARHRGILLAASRDRLQRCTVATVAEAVRAHSPTSSEVALVLAHEIALDHCSAPSTWSSFPEGSPARLPERHELLLCVAAVLCEANAGQALALAETLFRAALSAPTVPEAAALCAALGHWCSARGDCETPRALAFELCRRSAYDSKVQLRCASLAALVAPCAAALWGGGPSLSSRALQVRITRLRAAADEAAAGAFAASLAAVPEGYPRDPQPEELAREVADAVARQAASLDRVVWPEDTAFAAALAATWMSPLWVRGLTASVVAALEREVSPEVKDSLAFFLELVSGQP